MGEIKSFVIPILDALKQISILFVDFFEQHAITATSIAQPFYYYYYYNASTWLRVVRNCDRSGSHATRDCSWPVAASNYYYYITVSIIVPIVHWFASANDLLFCVKKKTIYLRTANAGHDCEKSNACG